MSSRMQHSIWPLQGNNVTGDALRKRRTKKRHIPLLLCTCNMTYQRHDFGFRRLPCRKRPYPEQACRWGRETPLPPRGRGVASSFVDIFEGHLP